MLMQKSNLFIVLISLVLTACPVFAVSNVQHAVLDTEVTITYAGDPSFQIQIRSDKEIGNAGGFVWAKTNSEKFTIDMGFADNPSRTFYYAVKDKEKKAIFGQMKKVFKE